jgi:hypothetical protein
VGETAMQRMVGRKSRRAHDGPFRTRVAAPDLSRAVDIPPPRLARTRESANLDGTPHPNGSNPARFSQQGGRRSPRRDFRPTNRPFAASQYRRNALSRIRVTRVNLSSVICHLPSVMPERASGELGSHSWLPPVPNFSRIAVIKKLFSWRTTCARK